MFYQIVLITKDEEIINEFNCNTEVFIIDEGILIDNNLLIWNNKEIEFDYLIIDDLANITNLVIEKENKKAITNFELQTSIENIFAFGKANNSNRASSEELASILFFLKNQN